MATNLRQTARAELTPAQKQELAIARRRQADEERRQRFLGDEKSRIIGLDRSALEAQAQQRKDVLRAERARDQFYDQERLRQAELIGRLENEKMRAHRQQRIETRNFQQTQTKQSRREWDLSDPKQLRNQTPPRVGDDEVLPASSLQMFDGEDLGYGDRVSMQRSQVRDWANQKIEEEQRAVERQKRIESEHAAYEKHVNEIADQLEQQKIASKLEHNRKTSEFNLKQAEQKRRNEAAQRQLEQQRGLAEVEHTLNSNLMTEARETTSMYWAPHRKVPYHFKGMSAQEKQAILDEQHRQRQELQLQREREQQEERVWAAQEEQHRREVVKRERERERAKKQQRIQVSKEQQTQAQQQKASYSYINNVVYTNSPSEGFHSQFGTTCR